MYHLSPNQKQIIADILIKLLADEHLLYLKTRNAHWNVEDQISTQFMFISRSCITNYRL